MKYALTFIFGAAAGAVVSFFVTRSVERKKADEQIAAVTSKMHEIENDNDILRDVKQKSDVNLNKPYDELAKEEPVEYVQDGEGGPIVKVTEIDYNAISNAKKPVKVKPIKAEDMIQSVDEQKYYDYVNNKNYGESNFTFYQGDGVLVDEETGMRVSSPEKYVGSHGVDAMRKVSVEEVYYVDQKDEIVNCIAISEDSYYEDEPEDDE